MTPVTHIASGLALATILNKVGIIHIDIMPLWYSPLWVLIISLISVLPDINALWTPIKKHHDDFTHYPLFWLAVGVVLGVIEFIKTGQVELAILFAGLILLHFVLDTVGFSLGLKWLAPFSYKEYSFTSLNKDILEFSLKDKGKTYLKYTALKIEIVILIFSVLICVFVR